MREYAEEGIQHFYFMMLQREQVAPILLPDTRAVLTLVFLPLIVHRRNETRRQGSIRKPLL